MAFQRTLCCRGWIQHIGSSALEGNGSVSYSPPALSHAVLKVLLVVINLGLQRVGEWGIIWEWGL